MAVNKRKILESAQKHLQKGALDKALKDYNTLLQDDPRDANSRLKVGDIQLRRGNRDEAIAAYMKVAQQFHQDGFDAKAVAIYKQVVKIDPKRHDVYVPLSELYQRLGLTSEAMSALQSAADAYNREGRQKEALDLLRKTATLDPTNTLSRLKIADLLCQADRMDDAIAEFEEIADELLRQNEPDKALTTYERMLEVSPDRTSSLLLLAKALAEQDRFDESEPHIQRALELEPESVEVHEAWVEVCRVGRRTDAQREAERKLAELHRERGNQDEAKELLQRLPPSAIDGDGREDEAAETEAIAEAEPQLADVAEVDALGFEPEQLVAEARVYVKFGKHDRAVQTLETLLEQDPDHADAIDLLGAAFAGQGLGERARETWQRGLQVARARSDAALEARFEEQIGELGQAAGSEAAAEPAVLPDDGGADILPEADGEAAAQADGAEAPAPEATPALEAEGDDDIEVDFVLDGDEAAPEAAQAEAEEAPALELALDEPSLEPTAEPEAPAEPSAEAAPEIEIELDGGELDAPAASDGPSLELSGDPLATEGEAEAPPLDLALEESEPEAAAGADSMTFEDEPAAPAAAGASVTLDGEPELEIELDLGEDGDLELAAPGDGPAPEGTEAEAAMGGAEFSADDLELDLDTPVEAAPAAAADPATDAADELALDLGALDEPPALETSEAGAEIELDLGAEGAAEAAAPPEIGLDTAQPAESLEIGLDAAETEESLEVDLGAEVPAEALEVDLGASEEPVAAPALGDDADSVADLLGDSGALEIDALTADADAPGEAADDDSLSAELGEAALTEDLVAEAEADADAVLGDATESGAEEPSEITLDEVTFDPAATTASGDGARTEGEITLDSGSHTAPQQVTEDLEEGEFYFAQGLHSEAEAIFQRVLAASPNHPQALLRLGEIAELRGARPDDTSLADDSTGTLRADPSSETMDFPVADFPPAVSDELSEAADALDAELSQPLGGQDAEAPDSLSAAEDDAEAELLGDEGLDPAPTGDAVPPAARAGDATVEPGETPDFDLAAELSDVFEEVESEPAADDTTSDRMALGFETIFQEFKEGVSRTLDEGDTETRYDLGIAYKEMGLLDDALSEFEQLSASTARRLDALHMMGVCLLELGRADDALAALQQALDVPDVPGEQENAIRFDLACAHEARGDTAAARSAFEQVAARDPDFRDVAARLRFLNENSGAVVEARATTGSDFESFDDLIAEARDELEEPAPESSAPAAEPEPAAAAPADDEAGLEDAEPIDEFDGPIDDDSSLLDVGADVEELAADVLVDEDAPSADDLTADFEALTEADAASASDQAPLEEAADPMEDEPLAVAEPEDDGLLAGELDAIDDDSLLDGGELLDPIDPGSDDDGDEPPPADPAPSGGADAGTSGSGRRSRRRRKISFG